MTDHRKGTASNRVRQTPQLASEYNQSTSPQKQSSADHLHCRKTGQSKETSAPCFKLQTSPPPGPVLPRTTIFQDFLALFPWIIGHGNICARPLRKNSRRPTSPWSPMSSRKLITLMRKRSRLLPELEDQVVYQWVHRISTLNTRGRGSLETT